MNSTETLPQGYKEILKIDLQKDKKLMLLVNGLALVVMIAMFIPALFVVPFTTLFEAEVGTAGEVVLSLPLLMVKMLVLLLGTIVYMVLHEAVHGIVMRRFCSAKVRFGFTGLYAFAGSDGYYCKRDYVKIALAPVVVWGVVLLILNCIAPLGWFYVVYYIQISNISGAMGDFYVTWRMRKLPEDILIQDTGVAMTVFAPENKE